MAVPLIAPVTISSRIVVVPDAARRVLPLVDLGTLRRTDVRYGLAAVDNRGRVSDRMIVRALHWPPGTHLNLAVERGLLVVQADADGVFRVNPHGYLQLPAVVRNHADLRPGDRVFLVADLGAGRLIVHPPALIDAMVTQLYRALQDGVPR